MAGSALLVDGLFIAAVTYAHVGVGSPLVATVVLHVVAVTLLSSFRTGFKVAVWHTLLMIAVGELVRAGLLGGS